MRYEIQLEDAEDSLFDAFGARVSSFGTRILPLGLNLPLVPSPQFLGDSSVTIETT